MHVTPEMRKAVFDEICLNEGHLLNFNTAITVPEPEFEPEPGEELPVPPPMQVLGPPGKIAHIHCGRCGRVWMVIEDEAPNYEVAEQSLKNRMRRPEAVVPKNKKPKKRPPKPEPPRPPREEESEPEPEPEVTDPLDGAQGPARPPRPVPTPPRS